MNKVTDQQEHLKSTQIKEDCKKKGKHWNSLFNSGRAFPLKPPLSS